MDDDSITMTKGELESIKSMIRVETTLQILRNDFYKHEESDKEHFTGIYSKLRDLERQWVKVTAAVATIVAIALIVQYFINIYTKVGGV